MHDIDARDETLEHVTRLRTFQIEGNGALSPLTATERARHRPHGVAGRRLELDHVRSEVGHQHGREGSCEVVAEVEHGDAFEGRPTRFCAARGGAGYERCLDLGEQLRPVLGERRCRSAHTGGGRDLVGRPGLGDTSDLGIVHLDEVSTGACLVVPEDLARGCGALYRDVGRPEGVQPLGRRPPEEGRDHPGGVGRRA